MDIGSLTQASGYTQPSAAAAASQQAVATSAGPQAQAGYAPLPPAAVVDLGALAMPGKDSGRYVRDADTRAMVFQVVDTAHGNVIDQFPSENALRNRAYAAAQAMREQVPGNLSKAA